MSRISISDVRVLAIDPCTKGFGFVVMEGQEKVIDWGTKYVKGDKNSQSLKRIEGLIDCYLPEVIIVEDCQSSGSRRCSRIRGVIDDIMSLASTKQIKLRKISRSAVKKAFSSHGAATKHEIAVAIAEQFPELLPYLPRLRKPWMVEDDRMNIFDAAALALAFFHARRRQRTAKRQQ